MADLVERLKKAATDFEAMRAYEANAEDTDCEPHYSAEREMAEATIAARDAAKEIALLRQAVVRYCDHRRMGTVEPPELQRAIDDAFALPSTHPKDETP
jgi:hypothetical protein